MKNLLLIVTLPLVLAACATAPAPRASAPAATVVASAPGSDVESRAAARRVAAKPGMPKQEDPVPALELNEDLLYRLLVAELAFQRGDWQTGYVTMLSVAQQTRDPRVARRAAEMALSAKRPDEALAAVRLWRTLAPNSDEAAQYYLSFVILSDKLDEARPILEQRLQEARPQTRNLMIFQIQRLLSRAKDKAGAFTVLEQVLAPYMNLPEAHLALAQSAYANGDNTRAHEEARIALEAKPDSELAALTLAQVSASKEEAAKSLEDFLARHPQAREVRTAYARLLVDQRRYVKARAEFEKLLVEQPQDLTTLFALGVLNTQLNDGKAAEKYLSTYLEVLAGQPEEDRDPAQALMLLAQLAEERKDSEAALKWLAQIEPGENYLAAQVKSAQILAKRGNIAQARKLLHEIEAPSEREQTQIAAAEGYILRDAGKLPEALAVLKAATERFPNNTDLLYDYAMVAEKSNQLEVMETALRKIMKLAPDNQHAYNALGYSLAERNVRLDEAYALIEKALQLAPEDPFILDSMGWVQFRLGRLKEAEVLLRRAYEIRPDAEIATHLGEVLWVKGQREDAQKLWRDAQSKDPQNDTLKSTLARLNVSL